MTDHALPTRRAVPSLAWTLEAPVPLILLAWAIFVAGSRFDWAGLGVSFGDTDDAMRLVEVRDLLAGQGWFDLHQYRLDPPAPVPMHWSRLVDAPQALLLLAFGSVFPPGLATKLMLFTWPPLTMLPALFAVRRLAVSLGGSMAALPAVLLTVWLMPTTWQFAPGRIDHHNVQIALTLWLLVCLVQPGRVAAAAAGLLSALMLAVGLETLPFVMLAGAAVALRFVLDGRLEEEAAAYGLSLAGATASLFVLTTPPGLWGAGACDALSASYLALAVAGGGILGLAALVSRMGHSALLRAGCVAAAGLAALAAFGLVEPACLRGPFSQIDPAIRAIWLDRVQEIQPVTISYREGPAAAVVTLVMPVLGLAAGLWLLLSAGRGRRVVLAALLLCLAAALVIGCFQIRTLVYANILGVPFVAAAIGRMGARVARDGGSAVLAVLGASLLSSSLAALVIVSMIPALADPQSDAEAARTTAYKSSCYSTPGYAVLGREPPGLVAAFVDSGPFILAGTGHSILAAPYHRMGRGIRLGYAFFEAPPEEARRMAAERGIAYVAFCASSGYAGHYADTAPQGLAARLSRGEIPDWLEPIGEAGSPIRAFRVKKA